MKLTKSQKIALGLLAAGLGALAYDRLGGTAAAEEVFETADVTAGPAAAPGQAAASPAESLADALRRLVPDEAAVESAGDAFAAPAAWFPVAMAAQTAPDERAARFAATHVLRAVLRSGRDGQALVDGRLVRVGQTLDGMRLVALSPLRATFAEGARRVTLSLPDASPAPATPPADAAPAASALPVAPTALAN